MNWQGYSNYIIFFDAEVLVWFQRLVSADEVITIVLGSILAQLVLLDPIQLSRIQILPPNLNNGLVNWIISDKTIEARGIVAIV